MNRRVTIGLVLLLLLIGVRLLSLDDTDPPPPPPVDAPSLATSPGPVGEENPPDKNSEGNEANDPATASGEDPESKDAATVPGFFLNLTGTVVDVVTRKPIEGARVLSVRVPTGGLFSCGDDTGADGRFQFTEWKAAHREGALRFVLQVSARGYEPIEMVPRRRVVTVELVPVGRALLPGTILGRAVDRDHRPLSGCLGIETKTDDGKFRYHTVLADREGRFALPGIAPGACPVRVEFSSDRPEVWVPEGGTVRVEVVSTTPIPSSPAERTRAGVTKRIEELQLTEMSCAMYLSDGGRLTSARRGQTREKFRKVRIERRWLQLRYRDLLGARTLVVTGLPNDGPAVLRAHSSPEYWCVAVTKGQTRLPSLTPGRWKLILERPGKPGLRDYVDVVEGKGSQTHRFGE